MAHRHESRERRNDTAKYSPTSTVLNAERDRLDAFVGKWHLEGQQIAGPAGSAASISAVQTYEWLAGGQFLIHRFEGHIGDADAACIEIIGFDAERRCYRAHSFYNNGQTNVWDIDERDDEWRVLGDWNAGDRQMKVRCGIRFDDDGRTMTSRWEHSIDGTTWQTFWNVSARKVTDH